MITRVLAVWSLLVIVAAPTKAQRPLPPFTAADRIVVVAPHPDDEILGAGGAIQQAVAAGADVRVVYLTSGDHNQPAFKLYLRQFHLSASQYIECGKLRQCESVAAMDLLGVPASHLTYLGYPDWGTLRLWRDYWNAERPFRSDATKSTAVPYDNAFRPHNAYTVINVITDLTDALRLLRPTHVLVTHPADSNPDHRAAGNFTRLAALQLSAEGIDPTIYYYLIHSGDWTRPLGYHPQLELHPPRALLDEDWATLPLTTAQITMKYNAILEYRSQLTIGKRFLFSLARANELFATIETEPVPALPADVPVDWRKAVRAKDPPLDAKLVQQGPDLIAQIDLKTRLGKRTGVNLFLFGFQSGGDFSALPKLRITIDTLGKVRVYDSRRRLKRPGVTVVSGADRFLVRVPLRLLGGKSLDHVFVSTRARLGQIPPNETAWRLFHLERADESG